MVRRASAAALALCVVVTILGCRAKPEPTIEYKLACIDAGTYVREDDPQVKRYAAALDALQRKFPSSDREAIADVAVVCSQRLADKGVRESVLDVLTHLDLAVPASAVGTIKLEEVAAGYLTLRAP